jgi:1-acyl-sn-glycerol-3-phosphate acyltransferase
MENYSSEKRTEPLDIRAVFKSKNPGIARLIPRFIYNYLKLIVHQDDLNMILSSHGEKLNQEFVKALVEHFNIKIEIEGQEKISKEGRHIFASNHPLGGFDGIMLMHIIGGYFKEFKFLVNDLLMNLSNIRDLFVPINKHGALGIQSVALIKEAFESNAQILTFPAGLVSRRIKRQIIDLPWQKSLIIQSVKYKRDIIPVHFNGRNSDFFYNLANFRKTLGIKANIEMFYLVNETFKHSNKQFKVKFGAPIPWQTFDNTKSPSEWAKWVKEKVYALDGIYNIPL